MNVPWFYCITPRGWLSCVICHRILGRVLIQYFAKYSNGLEGDLVLFKLWINSTRPLRARLLSG